MSADPNCGVAHGHGPADRTADRVLVAVFASPVSAFLLRYGADLGFRSLLVEPDAARVHRPIGLDIGSRAPAEIAVSTLAGLLADRNGRTGGFAHAR